MKIEDHKHPVSGEILVGMTIEPGTQLEEGDYYASTSGGWQLCPCPGLILQSGVDVIWVRPLA